MNDDLGKIREVFKEEVRELLTDLETSLLELENMPDNKESIGRIFRAMHTIKGASSMFGYDTITRITHEAESIFDMVRKGKIKVTKELIDLTLPIIDHIMGSIKKTGSDESADEAKTEIILSAFKKFSAKPGQANSSAHTGPIVQTDHCLSESTGRKITYRICFRPARNIFLKGINPVIPLNELCRMGRCSIVARTDIIPELDIIDPEAFYIYWDIILTATKNLQAVTELFTLFKDDCELTIDIIGEDDALDSGEAHTYIRELLIQMGEITRDDFVAIRDQGRGREHGGLTPYGKVIASADGKQQSQGRYKGYQSDIPGVRISLNKLDKLMNLVAELVTAQARLGRSALLRADPELHMISEEVGRLTGELRASAMDMRMVPIGTAFNRIRRLVRDVSHKIGKEVELTTAGGDTELDQNLIEKLKDLLMHIIHNSIDHGIEKKETREAAGKRRKGTVHLSASYSGAQVVIEIKDDGQGMDREAIYGHAVSNGLITEEKELTEKEILNLVFTPGFSTSRKITSISGRGVGLDIVKSSIDSLNGSVQIDSQRGKGTTITVKIPLTLAIIDGFLVQINGDYFVMPLSLVEECIELTGEAVSGIGGRHMVNVRGEIVPYIRLRELFHVTGRSPFVEQVVILRVEEGRIGFVVDTVTGEHQTVMKSMGRFCSDIDGISGATILCDGTVALILDIPKLIRAAKKRESLRIAGGGTHMKKTGALIYAK